MTFKTALAAAEHVGVTERTVRRWITSGRLPARKEGRGFVIELADLEAVEFRRHGARVADPELDALAKTVEALDPLGKDARERVWRWARDRFDIAA